MKMIRKSLIGMSFVMVSLISVSANVAVIDFNMAAPTTGSLSYAGGSTALNGSYIEVDNIVGIGTPSNAGTTITCDSCLLTFTTGANTGGWDFGSGGSISIIGGASTAGIGTGSTLLSGTFNSASVYQVVPGEFNFEILGAGFNDTKHPDLLTYFGITSNDFVGGLNLSFKIDGAPNVGDAFDSEILYSGDVVNTLVPVPAGQR